MARLQPYGVRLQPYAYRLPPSVLLAVQLRITLVISVAALPMSIWPHLAYTGDSHAAMHTQCRWGAHAV